MLKREGSASSLYPDQLCSLVQVRSHLVGDALSLADLAVMGQLSLLRFPESAGAPLAGRGVPGLADDPQLAPLWAWLVARELPPIWTFVGGAVILIAIIMQALMSAARELRHVGSRR